MVLGPVAERREAHALRFLGHAPGPENAKEEIMRISTGLAAATWGLLSTVAVPGALSAQAGADTQTTVTVQNERNDHVAVYIERVGSPVIGNVLAMNALIGEVAPASTSTFELPEWAMEQLEGDLTFVLQVAGQGQLEPVRFAADSGDDLGIIVVEQDDLTETLEAPTVEPGEASVTVLNNRAVPVLVLMEHMVDGRGAPVHILIGTASPDSDTTFPIPSPLVGEGDELRFVLHPVGGPDMPTQVMRLGDEARIEIVVPE
jgi:hypothetical protein